MVKRHTRVYGYDTEWGGEGSRATEGELKLHLRNREKPARKGGTKGKGPSGFRDADPLKGPMPETI